MSSALFPLHISVTDQDVDLSSITSGAQQAYHALLEEIIARYTTSAQTRFVVGIAGPSGAGKSVTAALLTYLAEQRALPFVLAPVSIDAFHFPNEALEARDLKRVKGRSDTYDVPALTRQLAAFAAGTTVSFPMYSRSLHEPVADSLHIEIGPAVLILEGLWILSREGIWGDVASFLDLKIYLEADPSVARRSTIARHVRGGRTDEDAAHYYAEVDAVNAENVAATRQYADLVIPDFRTIA